ncbi:MAG TPA: AraC family transcriptional regulator [Alphaproteobacteria bacterium]|nr:AraC family transcriptional regulator [Alphaproteobacteria bacterium]
MGNWTGNVSMSGLIGVLQEAPLRLALFDIADSVCEHAHPQFHVLIKLSGDDRTFSVGDEICQLTDDKTIVIPPWLPHADLGESEGSTLMLAFYAEPRWIEAQFGLHIRFPSAASQPVISGQERRLLSQVSTFIADASASRDDIWDITVQLMGSLLRHTNLRSGKLSDVAIDFRIRRAIWLIHGQPHGIKRMDKLAKAVGMSRSHFYAQFHKATGIPPRIYVEGLMIEQAIHRLVDSRQSIKDISDDLGYSAQSHFCRFFRSKVGFPPSSFRQFAISA